MGMSMVAPIEEDAQIPFRWRWSLAVPTPTNFTDFRISATSARRFSYFLKVEVNCLANSLSKLFIHSIIFLRRYFFIERSRKIIDEQVPHLQVMYAFNCILKYDVSSDSFEAMTVSIWHSSVRMFIRSSNLFLSGQRIIALESTKHSFFFSRRRRG